MVTEPADDRTCSVNYIQHILEIAKQYLPDDGSLAKLEPPDCQDVYGGAGRIPQQQALDAVNAIYKADQSGDIGVCIGSNFKPGTFGLVGFACMFCETLRQAIQLNSHYQPITQQFGTTTLEESDNTASLCWQSSIDEPCGMVIDQAVMAGYASFGRWLAWNPHLTVERVEFSHPEPQRLEQIQNLFGCDIRFNAPRTRLHFSRDVLDQTLQHASLPLLNQVKRLLDLQWALLQNEQHLTMRIIGYLGRILGSAKPSLSDAAEYLGMSERSLKRKLQLESTSFSAILTDVRKELAFFYLSATDIALVDVSDILGFVDQSAFTRAFKLWVGCTPANYRRQQAATAASLNSV